MNQLTTIASLPSGGGCKSAMTAEKHEPAETVAMRAPYFAEALQFPEIDHGLIGKPIVNVVINYTVGGVATISQVRDAVAGAARRHSDRFKYDERN